jgi:carboxyl-terminal processing protease
MRNPNSIWSRLATVLIVGFALIGLSQAQSDDDSRERAVLGAIGRILPEGHLSQHPLDDAISRRALDDLVQDLDPSKLYFLKSDVENLGRWRDRLDDMVRSGDDGFAKSVAALFLKRLEERVGWVHEFLGTDLKFDQDEFWVTDPKRADFAATSGEARDRWRRRVKYEILSMEGPDIPRAKAIEKLSGRYDRFLSRMKGMDSFEWLAIFVNAVTTAYDPHTSWLTPREMEDFAIAMRLNFEGIGAVLRDDDGYPTVGELMPGGSAIRDGRLATGDRILSVGQGADGAWKDVVGLPLPDVVALIRGPVGTTVRLQVRPKNGGETRTHALVRRKMQIEDSAAHGEVFELKGGDGRDVRIGVINLPEFYRDDDAAAAGSRDFRSATRDVARILADFRRRGVSGVVLDLRLNGGGSLKEAVDLTGLFIDVGPVVRVRDSGGVLRDLVDDHRGMAWAGPLVVLTSRLSASASEILAGAIQDYHRGLIVGDVKTHGKGTVQTVLPLDRYAGRDGVGALKLTIQQFYRPGGLSTQLRGVTPDVILPAVTSDLETGEEELAQALPFDQVPPARFAPERDVNDASVRQLDDRSRGRRAASAYFKKLESSQAFDRRQKQAGRVPLEEKAFRALRAEQKATDDDDDALKPDRNRITRDGYLDEVLSIAVDLVGAGRPSVASTHGEPVPGR